MLLGAAVLTGWAIGSQPLVQLFPGAVAMVANTAIGFLTAGIALAIPEHQLRAGRRVRRGAALLLLTLATLATLENTLGINIGIDQLLFKPWFADPNPHPGRLSPLTCAGFFAAGACLLLLDAGSDAVRAAWPVQFLSLAILSLGILGVTGYSLKLELLYGWYRLVRMAPHTAMAFLVLGLALWLRWYRALRSYSAATGRGDRHITAIAAVILLTMALGAGMTSAVLSAQRTEAALHLNMVAAHSNRAQLLSFVLENTLRQAQSLASDPALLRELNSTPHGPGHEAMASELEHHLLSDGYSAVAALNMDGVALLRSGRPSQGAPLTLKLRSGDDLLWSEVPTLRMTVPIYQGRTQVGTIVAERLLPVVTTLLADAALLGATGDIAICSAADAEQMHCLPTRLNQRGFNGTSRKRDGAVLPMSLALDGKTGLAVARDYRRHNVIAAYGPIGNTGLGLVVKEDAIDVYEPIRTQLTTMLAVLALLFVSGLLLLHWQVTPLIAALLSAKRRARAGEAKLQAILDNMAEGLLTIDDSGAVKSINPAAAAMFGYGQDELVDKNVGMLIEAYRPGPAQPGANAADQVPSTFHLPQGAQVPGRRRDGSTFPLQMAVRAAQHEGSRLSVAILRDISDEKKASETSMRFSAFLDATPNLVAFVSEQQTLLYMNGAGRTLLGIGGEDDAAPASMARFDCPGGGQPALAEVFAAAAQAPWRGEMTLCADNGAALPLLLSVVRIAPAGGGAASYAMVGVDVSERKLAEDHLRKSLERFNLVARATNDTVWDWDFATDTIWWNAGIAETFGHDLANQSNSSHWWVEQIHPDDHQWVTSEVEHEIASGGQYWTGEYRFRCADGSYAYVHDRGYIIRSDSGAAVRMIGAMMNISERKLAEERMRQLEERFTRIFSMSPVPIAVSRLSDGRLLEMNDAFHALLGQGSAASDAQQLSAGELWVAPDAYQAMMAQVIQEGTVRDLETQLRTSDVQTISVLFSADVVDLSGSPHLLCTYNDITQRKRTEDQLRLSEEKFRSIVETTKDWVWSVDTAGRILYSNPAIESMLGHTPEQLLGQTMLHLVHPDEREAVMAELQRLQQRGDGWNNWLIRWRHQDGSDRYLESSAVPVLGRDGELTGYRGTDHDVTAIKKYEIQLRESTRKAETANEAKSKFLANMSHEIRTPMNGVIGLTRLLLNTELSAQQRDYMELIESSADSLLRLLNDILDFSKMEARKLTLEKVAFDLRDEIGNVLRGLAAGAAGKGLELAYDVAPDVPQMIIADQGRLAQILINLTSNAIKFTPQGEVVLTVSQNDQRAGYVELHVCVSDTGIGIAPQQQARIFDSFVQADASTTRQFGGTGLGLAIVSQLVALMGGRLWVDSEPGVGTQFHFTIAVQPGEPAGPQPGARHQLQLRHRKVLVIDDNPTSGNILVNILRSWKIRPTLALNAVDLARHLADARAGDGGHLAAVCSSAFLGSNAAPLLAALGAAGLAPRAVVVLLPPQGGQEAMRAWREVGLNAFIKKPVKHSELFAALMGVLDEAGSAPDSPAPPAPPLDAAPARLHVLVADDHPVNQILITELLRSRGHSFVVANNGLEVLDLLSTQKVDAVLMDGQMPDMDGYQATAEIRRREAASGGHLHIVAVTAHAMTGDREACLAAGMDDYLAKPIDPLELYACLERPWLGAARAEPARQAVARPRLAAPPAAAAAGTLAFDPTAALERARGKTDLLAKMAASFIDTAPGLQLQLHAALASADLHTMERTAHRLKGAAATLAGTAVAQAAQILEQHARAGEHAGAGEALHQLDTHVGHLVAALTAHLETST